MSNTSSPTLANDWRILTVAPSWKAAGSMLEEIEQLGVAVTSETLIVVEDEELFSPEKIGRLQRLAKERGARLHVKGSVKKLSKLEETARRHREEARAMQPEKIADARHQSFVGKYHPAEFEKLLDKIPHATISESVTPFILSIIVDAMYWHGDSVRDEAEKKVQSDIIFCGGLQDPGTGRWCALECGSIWTRRFDVSKALETLAPLLDEEAT